MLLSHDRVIVLMISEWLWLPALKCVQDQIRQNCHIDWGVDESLILTEEKVVASEVGRMTLFRECGHW